MRVLLFGTTTDRQVVAKPNSEGAFDLLFHSKGADHSGCVTEFTIDKQLWQLSLTHEGAVYYCAIPTGLTVEAKKLKPAIMIRDAPEANRMKIGMFADEDADAGAESDYNMLTLDGKMSLVDHPKFDKCGIGVAEYASAFYCSDTGNQQQVVPPAHPPDIGGVAQAAFNGAKKKADWLGLVAGASGLSDTERQMFMQPQFEADINRTAIVFQPEAQAQAHTASQLLLRVPPLAVDEAALGLYAKALAVDADQLGMTGDVEYTTAVLGKSAPTARSLRVYGENAHAGLQLVASALALSRPSSVVLDVHALRYDKEQIEYLLQACKDKQLTLVLPRAKEHNALAERMAEIDGSVEVCRTKMQQACASRSRNKIEFCAVSHARGELPFGQCGEAWERLLSPVFCTSMLHHQTWMPVAVSARS